MHACTAALATDGDRAAFELDDDEGARSPTVAKARPSVSKTTGQKKDASDGNQASEQQCECMCDFESERGRSTAIARSTPLAFGSVQSFVTSFTLFVA